MPRPGGSRHQFGPFHYDAEQRLLFRNGDLVPLVPKALDTLHVLIERRGQVVGKDELLKLVWPDTTVEEIGLARNISLLRKALGDDAETYIQTVPKRGYRFVGDARAPGRPWKWLAIASAVVAAFILLIYWQFYAPSKYLPDGSGYTDVIVLPFDSLSAGLRREGFSQFFNELLVTELSKLKQVHVISPSTVRRYQWVGVGPQVMARLLGVEVILEGTAQRAGGRLRVTARLADVHSGKLIWAENYDQKEEDPVLARLIASEVGKLLAERPAKN